MAVSTLQRLNVKKKYPKRSKKSQKLQQSWTQGFQKKSEGEENQARVPELDVEQGETQS